MLIQFGMLPVNFLPNKTMFSQTFTALYYVISFLLQNFSIFLMSPSCLILSMVQDKHAIAWQIEQLKSFGSQAVQRKDYFSASAFYTKVWYILSSSFLLLIIPEKRMHVIMQIFQLCFVKWQCLVIEKETWSMALSRDNYLEKYDWKGIRLL